MKIITFVANVFFFFLKCSPIFHVFQLKCVPNLRCHLVRVHIFLSYISICYFLKCFMNLFMHGYILCIILSKEQTLNVNLDTIEAVKLFVNIYRRDDVPSLQFEISEDVLSSMTMFSDKETCLVKKTLFYSGALFRCCLFLNEIILHYLIDFRVNYYITLSYTCQHSKSIGFTYRTVYQSFLTRFAMTQVLHQHYVASYFLLNIAWTIIPWSY